MLCASDAPAAETQHGIVSQWNGGDNSALPHGQDSQHRPAAQPESQTASKLSPALHLSGCTALLTRR